MSLIASSLSENRRTLALAAPITAGHVGQMLMGWADTIMVAHIGVVPLAACAFANTVLAVPLVFGFGLLSAVSVRASHAYGAENPKLSGEVLRAGVLLAAVTGVLVAAGIQLSLPLLPVLGQNPEVNAACKTFLILCGWSVVPVFLTCAAKNFCEALSRPWIPFWIMMGGVLLNVVLNWIFIYGNLGAPRMGLDGAGLATLIARIAVTIVMFLYAACSSTLAAAFPRQWFAPGILRHLRGLLGIGLPAGAMHLSEVSGFAFGSIMMGWISVNALAAHQIAITCAATTFMVPLGLSQAVSVRVGQSRGARQIFRCAPIIFGALGVTILFMAVFAALFLSFGTVIASWFVDTPEVIVLAAQLLLMAGFFQVFDGVQIVSAGALRGFEDTRVPLFIGAFSYWFVALPVSYFTAFAARLGAPGIWLGFVCGLIIAAAALFARVLFRLRAAGAPAPAALAN